MQEDESPLSDATERPVERLKQEDAQRASIRVKKRRTIKNRVIANSHICTKHVCIFWNYLHC